MLTLPLCDPGRCARVGQHEPVRPQMDFFSEWGFFLTYTKMVAPSGTAFTPLKARDMTGISVLKRCRTDRPISALHDGDGRFRRCCRLAVNREITPVPEKMFYVASCRRQPPEYTLEYGARAYVNTR